MRRLYVEHCGIWGQTVVTLKKTPLESGTNLPAALLRENDGASKGHEVLSPKRCSNVTADVGHKRLPGRYGNTTLFILRPQDMGDDTMDCHWMVPAGEVVMFPACNRPKNAQSVAAQNWKSPNLQQPDRYPLSPPPPPPPPPPPHTHTF